MRRQPEVEAIAVADGRIVGAGTRVAMLALAGEGTQRIDVPGIAVPGWVDAHAHISGLGSTVETLNVERMTKEAIAKAVAAAAQKTPAGDWIIGRGWDEGYFATREDPIAADLDPVTPQHPVMLSGIARAFSVGQLARARAGGHCQRNIRPARRAHRARCRGAPHRPAAGGGPEAGHCSHAGREHGRRRANGAFVSRSSNTCAGG